MVKLAVKRWPGKLSLAVKTTPGLDDVGLFLAGWGYNTPPDREAARSDGRVVLLALEQFAREFPEWLEG